MQNSERLWEAPSSSGGKFWAFSINGTIVTTRWGKINAKGQTKLTDHTSEEKANKYIETMIKKKEKDGYEEVSAKLKNLVKPKLEKEIKPDYSLPWLYSTDAKGKERIWKIWVTGNKVNKKHGEVKGKQTMASRTYEGKNKGRSNETTSEEQANREAERDWVKQIDKGYKPKTKKGMDVYRAIQKEKSNQGGVNVGVSNILAYKLRGVKIVTPVKSKSAESKKAEKEAKKAINGALPNYKTNVYPMGCQKWVNNPKNFKPEDKVLKYFNFKEGVYLQRKLDGIRALVRIVEDEEGVKWVVMVSRQGNQFVHLKKLREEVSIFLKDNEDLILDCEIYAEDIYASVEYKGKDKIVFTKGKKLLPKTMNFKAITSTVRSTMTNPGSLEDQMCLYIFDIVDPTETLTQTERFEKLDELFERDIVTPHIKKVETYVIHKIESVKKYHDKFAKEGYEGVVLRAKDLKYECLKKNRKSKSMRKYKYFLDSEFEIIGVKCDSGVEREQFTWICKTENGTQFYPKPEGTREMKWEWYDNSDEYIGKMLTVRYQGIEESGRPRFPIGVEIRDYE